GRDGACWNCRTTQRLVHGAQRSISHSVELKILAEQVQQFTVRQATVDQVSHPISPSAIFIATPPGPSSQSAFSTSRPISCAASGSSSSTSFTIIWRISNGYDMTNSRSALYSHSGPPSV